MYVTCVYVFIHAFYIHLQSFLLVISLRGMIGKLCDVISEQTLLTMNSHSHVSSVVL